MKRWRAVNWRAVRARTLRWLSIGAGWVRARAAVLLDVAAFVSIVVGVDRLFGDWSFLAAGVLLILAGLRASE